MRRTGEGERHCVECGLAVSGRADKKFCCDSCRTAYHNSRVRKMNTPKNEVDRILAGNRRLLTGLTSDGITKIALADTRMKTFDRFYYTSAQVRRWRTTVYCCYEYRYTIRHDFLQMV